MSHQELQGLFKLHIARQLYVIAREKHEKSRTCIFDLFICLLSAKIKLYQYPLD